MKKYIIAMIIGLGIGVSSYAQSYIQGLDVIPFTSAATSNLLTVSGRLDMQTAYTKLTQLDNQTTYQNKEELVGEFWWIDGMLVRIICRNLTADYPAEDFSTIRYAKRPEVIYTIGGTPPDRTRQNDYFDDVKNVNNFEVLVHYYKTLSNLKRFNIQDNQKRYKISGTVYTSDHQKAHALIDTLLNSITFK